MLQYYHGGYSESCSVMFGSSDLAVSTPFSLIIPYIVVSRQGIFRLMAFLVTKCSVVTVVLIMFDKFHLSVCS